MDFLFGTRKATKPTLPTLNQRASVNYTTQQQQQQPPKKSLPPPPSTSNYQLASSSSQRAISSSSSSRASVSLNAPTVKRSASHNDLVEVVPESSSASAKELKFLSPYIIEPRATGYSIDHFPQSFIEPFNSFTPSLVNDQVDFNNIENQMDQYEKMVHAYGPQNFSSKLLSNLISLFGNSPTLRVQDQLVSLFKRVVPHKSVSLSLEYWSVMNIVCKNSDSYSAKTLFEFANLAEYFDPTSADLDLDVLNLSLVVCLRMCEAFPNKVPLNWSLLIKILYKNPSSIKLNQHWDSIILLFNNTTVQMKNKIEFASILRMLIRDHEDFLVQQINDKADKRLPSILYLELCVALVQYKPTLASHTYEFLNAFIDQIGQTKAEKNVAEILLLPKSLNLIMELLLAAVHGNPSDCSQIFQYLQQLVSIDDGWFLIETLENGHYIERMRKNLLSLCEECALVLHQEEKYEESDLCVTILQTRGEHLRARVLANLLRC